MFIFICMHAKPLQSRPALCDPMDYSLPGSSVHGVLQVRILEWVAMPSLQGIFSTQGLNSGSPVAPELQEDSLLLSHCSTLFK